MMAPMTEATHTQAFWEDFYRERPVWSGKPNALLVREVAALPPGTALDLGCAEGADAVWLAQGGWRVTAADVSPSALRRAAAHAAEAGVAVDWQCHDLSRTFPDGTFDLVCAQYLHTPVEVDGERSAILRRASAAVAPGGVLLVIGHEKHERHPEADLPTTGEVLAGLDLDPAEWRVELEDVVERAVVDPDGRPGTRRDNVLRVRRTGP
jgi:2-polyprenyl-3-methyl-5-hydroxy-6-metoxy-1,4-benzoquinol methylase